MTKVIIEPSDLPVKPVSHMKHGERGVIVKWGINDCCIGWLVIRSGKIVYCYSINDYWFIENFKEEDDDFLIKPIPSTSKIIIENS